MFIATLIAEAMRQGDVSEARDRFAAANVGYTGECRTVQAGVAYDFTFTCDPEVARVALEGAFVGVDVVVQPVANREKKLLVADMDSTMITVECIDELADYAGIKPQIAAVTEAAMRGELDFAEALRARVALLGGLPETVLQRCYDERVRITPGAVAAVRTMRIRGARCVLVSGGFHYFAARVASEIGFHNHVANTLGVRHRKLDGTVGEPIVGAERKRAVLFAERGRFEWLPTMAVGDGANDLPMIAAADLGVAYHAKPIVAAAAAARIDHNDLTALLYAQGIPRSEWVLG